MDTVEGVSVSPARRHIIKRPRITRLLDATSSRVILLVAPAGYGKTTLARQWLEERPHGWYSATPASSDVAALAAGVAAAASAFVEGAGSRMMERLGASGAPPPSAEALAGLLAEDLGGWPNDAWLAIDDYHLAMESAESEEFVDELIAQSPLRLILTSRLRPGWATARRILYGEILEVGRSTLALTHDEAGQVLSERNAKEVAGLMAVADGWPAVIGLASLSRDPLLSEAQLPDTLYEYCAEELFSGLDDELQSALCRLVLAPGELSHAILESVLGGEGPSVARQAEEAGFLHRVAGDGLIFHPLLRVFLEAKTSERPSDETRQAVRQLSEIYRLEKRWDDAFQLIARSRDSGSLDSLVDAALDDLIGTGRVGTLARWLEQSEAFWTSPLRDLAESEVAFRAGGYSKAQVLAETAAQYFGNGHTRTSHAWRTSGYGAYFRNDLESARERLSKAVGTASNDASKTEAIWGLLNVTYELEDEAAAREYLAQLSSLASPDPLARLRLMQAELIFSYRLGDQVNLNDAEQLAPSLLERVGNPVSRTGFLNTLSWTLAIAGRYEEALTWSNQLIVESETYRLPFATPHGYLTRARAECGLRRFSQGLRTLDRLTNLSGSERNSHVEANEAIIRARIELSRGRHDVGYSALEDDVSSLLDRATWAEWLGTRALALASLGETAEALREVDRASSLTSGPEPRAILESVRAIAALRAKKPSAERLVLDFIRQAFESKCLDVFVIAYRIQPELLSFASRRGQAAERELKDVVLRARDWRLGRTAGINVAKPRRTQGQLSPRELEVYELLAQGLSNRDISQKLYISDVTVKVHVRHIFEKLGVRSRAQAVALAVAIEESSARSAPDSPG